MDQSNDVVRYAVEFARCYDHFRGARDERESLSLAAWSLVSYCAGRGVRARVDDFRGDVDGVFPVVGSSARHIVESALVVPHRCVGGVEGFPVGFEDKDSCVGDDVGVSGSQKSGEVMEDVGAKQGEVGKSGVCDSGVARGRWFERNRRKREMRKARRVATDVVLKSPARSEFGYFSACDEAVRADLRSSRAKMLIAQNEQRARKAAADVDRMNMEKDTRVNEAKFELNRLSVDEKLRKISEARMGGSAQTVLSSITSSPPSLSSGSVSPNSSISVAEEMRLRNAVSSLTLEVEQLKKKQVNEIHDGVFTRREVRGTGVYRVYAGEDEFDYS